MKDLAYKSMKVFAEHWSEKPFFFAQKAPFQPKKIQMYTVPQKQTTNKVMFRQSDEHKFVKDSPWAITMICWTIMDNLLGEIYYVYSVLIKG